MHTKQQTLDRLNEIVEFVQQLPEENLKLSSWARPPMHDECGTIACVVGWMALKGMYGLHVKYEDAELNVGVVEGENIPEDAVCTPVDADGRNGFSAVTRTLFGIDDIYPDDTVRIAHDIGVNAFTHAGLSRYDPPQRLDEDWVELQRRPKLSDKQVFLNRVPGIIRDIDELYRQIL